LSYKAKKLAKKLQVHYSFLFMKPNGDQLAELTTLIESGVIRPIIDKMFPFSATNEAMAYVETGRAKGKVVIKVK
jgi:alcohol dehydrogenase